ncbi:MAG: hypothetical protein JWR74_1337, partial [Polaromonas sp.]|nr:hypothetical protein [Polaromonas sp.]
AQVWGSSDIVGDGAVTLPSARAVAFGGAHGALLAPRAASIAFGGASAALALSGFGFRATGHNSTGENAFTYTMAAPSVGAAGGGNARIACPAPGLSGAATVAGWGHAALFAQPAALQAEGTVSAMGAAALTLYNPFRVIGYSGAVCSVRLGAAAVQASGTTGSIGRAALTLPLFELTAAGTAQNHGSASLLAPAARLGATAQAWLTAPGAQLTAIGSAVVVASYEAYAVNLKHSRAEEGAVDEVTRYTNFPFTQIVRYQGSYFGMAADGLYLLETGTTDDGEPIAYALTTALDDLDTPQEKNIASAFLAGRLGPDTTVTLHAGEDGDVSYDYNTLRGLAARTHREKFGRGVKNHYFAIGLSGEDALELDSIELEVTKSTRRI